MKCITHKDIEALEGLAPGLSNADEKTMRGRVLSGTLFRNFPAADREHICQTLTRHKGRILSLRLFFQDIMFFAMGAYLMRKLLSPEDYRNVGYEVSPRQCTVRSALAHNFYAQTSGNITIQASDTGFFQSNVDEETQFDLAYRQLWLCAWRSSRCTPGEGNKPVTLQRETHPQAQYQLALFASELGFKSQTITNIISKNTASESNHYSQFERHEMPDLKRQGVPYTVTFREDRKCLFLDRMHATMGEDEELCSLSVLRDIYISFFGNLTGTTLNGTTSQRSTTHSNTYVRPEPASSSGKEADEQPKSPNILPNPQPEASQDSSNSHSHPAGDPESSGHGTAQEAPIESSSDASPPLQTAEATGNAETQSEDRISGSEFERTEARLRQQLEELNRTEGRWKELNCIFQSQKRTVEGLSCPKIDIARFAQGIVEQLWTDLRNDVSSRLQILNNLESQIRSHRSDVEQSLCAIEKMRQEESARFPLDTTAFNIFQSAQRVAVAVEGAISTAQAVLKEGEILVPLLWRGIKQVQVADMALRLKLVHGDILACCQYMETIISGATDLAQLVAHSDGKDLKIEIDRLRCIYTELSESRDLLDSQLASVHNADLVATYTQWLNSSSELELKATEAISAAKDTTDQQVIGVTNIAIANKLQVLQDRHKIEKSIIDGFRTRVQQLHDQSTSMKKAIEYHKVFLDTHMATSLKESFDSQWDKLDFLGNSGEIDAIYAAVLDSKTELDALILRNGPFLTIRECLDGLELIEKSMNEMEDRDRRQSDLRKRINLDEEIMGQILSSMVQEIERLLVSWGEQATDQSSKALSQKEIAKHTEDLDAAREAAMAANHAAAHSNYLLKNMVDGQGLISGAPHLLQEKVAKIMATGKTAAQQANNAARSAAKAVKSAELYIVLKRPKEAIKLARSYEKEERKTLELAQKFFAKMEELTTTTILSTKKIQESHADQASPSSILLKVRNACVDTISTAFSFYQRVAGLIVEYLENGRSEIVQELDFAALASEKEEVAQLFAHSGRAQETAKQLAQAVETSNEVERAVAGHTPVLELSEEQEAIAVINKYVNDARNIQTEINSMIELKQVAWWTKLTGQKRQKAMLECVNARTVLEQASEGHSIGNEAKIALIAIEQRLSNTTNEWEGCYGPAEKLQSLAAQFEDISEKAESLTRTVPDHSRVDEDIQVPEERERWIGCLHRLKQNVKEFYACRAEYKKSDISSAMMNTTCEKTERLMEEVHSTIQEMQSYESNISGSFEQPLATTAEATGDAIRLLSSMTQVMTDLSDNRRKDIERQRDPAKVAADSNDRKGWDSHLNVAGTVLKALDLDVWRAMKVMDAVEKIKNSFDGLRTGKKLSSESLVAVSDTIKCVEASKISQDEAKNIVVSIAGYWWHSKATSDFHRATKAVEEATEKFSSLERSAEFRREYRQAAVAHRVAVEAFEKTKKDWRSCLGPAEEYRKMGENFTDVYNKAVAALKAADTIRERQAAAASLEGSSQFEYLGTGKRAKHDLPRPNQSPRSIRLYKMTNGIWESETRIFTPGRARDKGNELINEFGSLMGLNPPELSRIAKLNGDNFVNLIEQGKCVFFVDAGCQLTSVDQLERARKYYNKHNR